MTMAEARKRAHRDALRNTGILAALAAGQYAAYRVKRKIS